MPDWFANRMHFSAESAQIAAIKRLASKDVAAAPFLPGQAGHGLKGFQIFDRRVECGLCCASIKAGLAKMQG